MVSQRSMEQKGYGTEDRIHAAATLGWLRAGHWTEIFPFVWYLCGLGTPAAQNAPPQTGTLAQRALTWFIWSEMIQTLPARYKKAVTAWSTNPLSTQSLLLHLELHDDPKGSWAHRVHKPHTKTALFDARKVTLCLRWPMTLKVQIFMGTGTDGNRRTLSLAQQSHTNRQQDSDLKTCSKQNKMITL